jgi:hypothetical protein
MPTVFDETFRRVKQLVADFRANEKFHLSPAYQEQEARRGWIAKSRFQTSQQVPLSGSLSSL